jgi:hypothetical protein
MLASEEPRERKAPTRGSVVGAESAMAPPTIAWDALPKCHLWQISQNAYHQPPREYPL